MREYKDAMWSVQRKHVRVLVKSSVEIRKEDSWK